MKGWKMPLKNKNIPSQGFFMDFVKIHQDICFTEPMAASGLLKWLKSFLKGFKFPKIVSNLRMHL